MNSLIFPCTLILLALLSSAAFSEEARNPIIWADVPDISMIRVGETYYMSSTTMHMSPGVPIMKSRDLVNWAIAGYAYDRLVESDEMNLENDRNCYGRGSWASSLRYHDGTFYVSTFSATSGRTHIYSTRSIENGPWSEVSFRPVLHDNSLFFDDDGRIFMVYGGGEIRIRELTSDLTGLKPGGVNQVIIENANRAFGESEIGGLPAEGSQLFKKDGKYFLFLIASPRSRWSRSVLVYRADQITGPYDGRVALQDRGIAQGGLIETPEGDWYSYLFGDRGAVGRIPYLVPVDWEDDWPVIGIDGKVPETLDLPMRSSSIPQIVASDDFERSENDLELPLVWQWNHNPDNQHWSILDDPGRLRITTSRIDHSVLTARNTLTQRTVGPVCSASVKIDASGMRDGDIGGLIALQRNYGFVGAKRDGGRFSVIATQAPRSSDKQIETVPLHQTKLYLRIDCDYRNQADVANFFYSLDGRKWKTIGRTLEMSYTMPHFMGYRFGLFNYATANPGGYVDFDDFTLDNQADF